MKNVISVKDLSKKEILEILENAESMIHYAEREEKPPNTPKNVKVVLAFLEPSTRTLGSFDQASRILDFERREISGPEATSLMKKESLGNTIRMLATQGAKIIVIRTPWEGAPRFATEILNSMGYGISVLNAGDGSNQHPTQTMLDLLTIKQTLGRLEKFNLGIVGDLKHSRTVHSLLQALRHFQWIRVFLFSTKETRLQDEYKSGFCEIAEVNSLEALSDCDIIYATRLQRERFKDEMELKQTEGAYAYLIDSEILNKWKNSVRVMHPLPCVDEISPDIYDDPRILMYKQAWYGIPTRMALLVMGYNQRMDKSTIPEPQKFRVEKIGEAPIKDKIEAKRKKEKYFSPITNGTLIDHITTDENNLAGKGDKVKLLLRNLKVLPHTGVTLAEGVPSSKFGIKDVLVAEKTLLNDEVKFLVALIAPNATFNHFDGVTSLKTKITVPEMIGGQIEIVNKKFKCPNSTCITNNDLEAKAKFWTKKQNNRVDLTCYYCEQTFSGEKIIFHSLGIK